jgi:Leucine-rich repeat (LRR) protein
LDLSNNQLTEVPESIADLNDTLNFLNVENNNIQKLPTILGYMKLTGLKIDGNPLKQIKRAVIDRGTVGIMEDLKNKHIGIRPNNLGRGIVKTHKRNTEAEEPIHSNNLTRPPTSSFKSQPYQMEVEE